MKIAYFVFDLGDPAVRKRVLMLQAGGADVTVIGFRRQDSAPVSIEGAPAIDLGRTFDARLGHRAASVIRNLALTSRWRAAARGADLIIARNLEMLAIAARARSGAGRRPALVYECLDIHRSMLSQHPASRLLRALERALMKKARLLIVSSPAFLRAYFEPRQKRTTGTMLIENKVLDLADGRRPAPAPPPPAPPWRIGWFGMIRCRKSLEILTRLAAAGQVEVIIRGRPAYTEFDDFDAAVARSPNVRFEGPYSPADLAAHYAEVHFTWGIDYFEEGLNSSWLLPNRLYEGSLHGSVPIALSGVETGAWLKARGAGVLITAPEKELAGFFAELTADRYRELKSQVLAIPGHDMMFDRAACLDLTARLATLAIILSQSACAMREREKANVPPNRQEDPD